MRTLCPRAHHAIERASSLDYPLVPKIDLDGERKLLIRSGLEAIDPLGENWFPTEAPSQAHFRAEGGCHQPGESCLGFVLGVALHLTLRPLQRGYAMGQPVQRK